MSWIPDPSWIGSDGLEYRNAEYDVEEDDDGESD